jgi:hypothetical protein
MRGRRKVLILLAANFNFGPYELGGRGYAHLGTARGNEAGNIAKPNSAVRAKKAANPPKVLPAVFAEIVV